MLKRKEQKPNKICQEVGHDQEDSRPCSLLRETGKTGGTLSQSYLEALELQ